MPYPIDACSSRLCRSLPSSEIQAQIVGARESLNGRKNKARRKVKNGEKSPWDNVLPDQFQTVAAVLASDLSPGALLAVLYFSFVPYFSACLDFPRPHYLPVGLRGWISASEDLCMPEDPGNEFEASPSILQELFSVYLRLCWRFCWLPQVLWPLTVILGNM